MEYSWTKFFRVVNDSFGSSKAKVNKSSEVLSLREKMTIRLHDKKMILSRKF